MKVPFRRFCNSAGRNVVDTAFVVVKQYIARNKLLSVLTILFTRNLSTDVLVRSRSPQAA